MMRQYFDIKDKYADYILMYRLGDFYEMFFEDAQIVSKELELTLTGRDCGDGERAPMCGVPYHSAEGYIGKLIENGHKVAICEQTEDPASAKGLVRREVVRVITPGTVIESNLLSESKNNYLACIYFSPKYIGLCFSDVSTAYVAATAVETLGGMSDLLGELYTYSPREIVTNIDVADEPQLDEFCKNSRVPIYVNSKAPYFDPAETLRRAADQFSLGADDDKSKAIAIAAGAALEYIAATEVTDLCYLKNITVYENSQYLEMDSNTRRNLELCETMLTKEKRGSLLWVLDHTSTAMGARLLRSAIERPLTNVRAIAARQGAVAELNEAFMLREELKELLSSVLDLERLVTKITYGTAGGRDLRAICQAVSVFPEILNLLAGASSAELVRIREKLDPLTDVYELINSSIVDDPPFIIREGGIIRDGYSSEVDELRSIMSGGKGYIENIEEEERDKTGIKNLRIRYNRVFGYYIEVTNSFLDLVPNNYIRKQTLTNCERYITDELKNMEATILGAEDKLHSLEYELFINIRDSVGECSDRIRQSAAMIASLDMYISLADVASKNNYVMPEIDYSDVLEIKDGRHPVVEQFVRDSYFVPNDTLLDTERNRLMLITGPNMAGKSTYMRQSALIVLMAQIGSFVPASSARVGIVDKLFTRVGASDDLASGQSTFMLEMKEVAYILDNATKRSLIIYDEIGRGTSTYDGMSIARAVAEYTTGKKLGAKTMFATHYHELTALEKEIDGVVNYNIAAKKKGDDIVFLRKIVKGPTDDSYGIEVARLAGVNSEIVKRAKEILRVLEDARPSEDGVKKKKSRENEIELTLPIVDPANEELRRLVESVDINTLTPIEAINCIYEWKKLLKGNN